MSGTHGGDAGRARRLPSLDTLRAFEVAARHLSFTRAATELHVTQSALSHRVKALEEELGIKLFRRLAQKLELTPQGEALAEGVRRGVAEMARACAALHRRAPAAPVTVSCLPSVAMRWLVPRLPRLKALDPGIDVRVLAEAELTDLNARRADVAIRFGLGRYPGLRIEPLMGDTTLAVAGPELFARIGPIARPEEIVRYPLIHDSAAEHDESGTDWGTWLAHCGAAQVAAGDGLRFNNAILVLEAAARGLGAALARRSLLADDLSAGRLVRLLPHEAPARFSYFLVSLPEAADDPATGTVMRWLAAEARMSGVEPREWKAPSRPAW